MFWSQYWASTEGDGAFLTANLLADSLTLRILLGKLEMSTNLSEKEEVGNSEDENEFVDLNTDLDKLLIRLVLLGSAGRGVSA